MSEHLVAGGPTLEELKKIGMNTGLDDLAVTGVEPIADARQAIEERKARGLHAGMSFTYGNAERATDPSQLFEGARSVLVGIRRYQPPSAMAQQTRQAAHNQRSRAV